MAPPQLKCPCDLRTSVMVVSLLAAAVYLIGMTAVSVESAKARNCSLANSTAADVPATLTKRDAQDNGPVDDVYEDGNDEDAEDAGDQDDDGTQEPSLDDSNGAGLGSGSSADDGSTFINNGTEQAHRNGTDVPVTEAGSNNGTGKSQAPQGAPEPMLEPTGAPKTPGTPGATNSSTTVATTSTPTTTASTSTTSTTTTSVSTTTPTTTTTTAAPQTLERPPSKIETTTTAAPQTRERSPSEIETNETAGGSSASKSSEKTVTGNAEPGTDPSANAAVTDSTETSCRNTRLVYASGILYTVSGMFISLLLVVLLVAGDLKLVRVWLCIQLAFLLVSLIWFVVLCGINAHQFQTTGYVATALLVVCLVFQVAYLHVVRMYVKDRENTLEVAVNP